MIALAPARAVRTALVALALTVTLSGTMVFAQHEKEKEHSPDFDRLKSLVGSWKGTDPQGKPISVSYKLVSEGTTIMEALEAGGHAESMVTMYHLNDGQLMLTHYCSMGNQPRLQMDKEKSSDTALVFTFRDGTNMKSVDEPHIHGLTITFKDKKHMSQEWVSLENGKEERETFTYERAE